MRSDIRHQKQLLQLFCRSLFLIAGEIKTVAQADQESLQAAWVSDLTGLALRSKDILPLVDKAKCYWRERSSFHKPVLPQLVAHNQLLLRVLVLIRKQQT